MLHEKNISIYVFLVINVRNAKHFCVIVYYINFLSTWSGEIQIMGKLVINLLENYVLLLDGTKVKYQIYSSRTNCQSIMPVGHLQGDNLDCFVTANLGLKRTIGDTNTYPAVGVNAEPMGVRNLSEGLLFNLNSLALSD